MEKINIEEIKNTIINGDCLEIMKLIEDKSVEVSFTSPPYNDTGNGIKDDEGKRKTNEHSKYLHSENRKDYFEWQCEVIDEMLRISKKLVLYNIQGIKNNRKALYKIIGKYSDQIHDIVIWHKPTCIPCGTPNKISNTYEMLLLLKPKGINEVSVNSSFYKNVITSKSNIGNNFSNIHKAVMSKDFCYEVIKEFTKENDTVLDPFFGMGTTGVCCLEQKRNFIGIELVPRYVEEANKRIEETKKLLQNEQTTLF